MRFKFKTQQYQTDAVNSIVDVFQGQPYSKNLIYKTDFSRKGLLHDEGNDGSLTAVDFSDIDSGFANNKIALTSFQILQNIRKVQTLNNITESEKLFSDLGVVNLDVEMETGTGKTYVYTKSIFELNKKYGFSKFIIVVPSIAIREGVKKSLQVTQEHFMDLYGKKARHFIYNSKKLDEIEHFSSSDSIQIMVINIQAFNARGADARKIYEELDEFQSRRPIDVISVNRPILILDEPQKMGGNATQESLRAFNPLFTINFSATHKIKHNLIYVLDALDAYNKKLVKKIEVKGFTVKNLRGTNGYLYFDDIIYSSNKPPLVKLEFEINYGTKSINRENRILKVGDNLYEKSNKMEQYKKGYRISEIDPMTDSVSFTNGIKIKIGEALGDVSEDDLRRIQIRETIKSHFEKESELFFQGIKVLSLFFIDEVAKYRKYDEAGNEINSIYGIIFEQEYRNILVEYLNKTSDEYSRYLKSISPSQTHKGYFSIDKKGRKIDSELKRGSDISDDESSYDLILKDKERLLSFEEPTRFIFSHSALREGWDNPNVFQICTLRHTNSVIQKHQEVGRGSRLCVNVNGDRMDATIPNINVHEINKLTVIANDSYETFVKGLQSEITNSLFERPKKAVPDYFLGKKLYATNGDIITINQGQANSIYRFLVSNSYLDENDIPNDNYRTDLENQNIKPFKEDLVSFAPSIHNLIQSVYNPKLIETMFENGNTTKILENKLNANFKKEEFQKLWKLINHRYAYFVDFDSNELIKKSIVNINSNLVVTRLMYTVSVSEQKSHLTSDNFKSNSAFKDAKTSTSVINSNASDHVEYDLLGKISQLTMLRRKTIGSILLGMDDSKFWLYKENPEEFINKISKIINDEKATMIVDHVTYNQIDGEFDSNIFAESKTASDFKKALKTSKHIKDFVFTDGSAERSIERVFAEDLERAEEVCVYAKLPRTFYIPTPVGNYSPDWAIAFFEGKVKHIYFIAETKGSMDSMQLRKIENVKIECARVLFNKISTNKVKYDKIDSYSELLAVLNGIK